MKKEKSKEILTKENIKRDIYQLCSYELKNLILYFIITVVLSMFLLFFVLLDIAKVIKIIIITYVILSNLSYIIYTLLKLFPLLKLINNDSFNIKKDILLSVEKNYYKDSFLSNFVMKELNYKLDKPYYLNFKSNTIYKLSKCDYYSWSKEMKTNLQGICHASQKGDEFYLVLIDENVVMVYNTNFFTLN